MTKIDVGDREKAKRMLEILVSGELNHREEEFTDRDIYGFLEDLIDQLEDEWRVIDTEWSNGFPSHYWEINRQGDIRHAQSKTTLDPKWDFTFNKYVVELQHKDQTLYVNGPGIAGMIFKEDVDAPDDAVLGTES